MSYQTIFGLIYGKSGIGKTSLLYNTLPHDKTILINAERCNLKTPFTGKTFEITSWAQLKDLLVLMFGPNTKASEGQNFSLEHYNTVCERARLAGRDPDGVSAHYFKDAGIEFIFVDSLTSLSRMAFDHCKELKRDKNTGDPDMRAAYQMLSDEFSKMLHYVKQFSPFHGWFTAVLEEKYDENIQAFIQVPQIESVKISQEMLTSFDEVFSLLPDPSKNNRHVLVTDRINPYGVPAKDRSNMLNALEESNLQNVSQKILGKAPNSKENNFESSNSELRETKSFISEAIDELRS